jgi:SWI/SNF-related matrix-associated actin-dependent regulator of chromatin subfamily A3
VSQPWREDEDIFDGGDELLMADELYVIVPTQVVGIQYYTGLLLSSVFKLSKRIHVGYVGSGENVMLRREPTNQFDRNAIRVVNFRDEQVGHLPRAFAARLSPLLDQNLVTVEGVIKEGNSASP